MLLSWLFRTQRVSRRLPRRRPTRLRLESLEDRWTPSTFTVNTLDDTVAAVPGNGSGLDANGNVSLRSAIQTANALGGNNTIFFANGLAGTIGLRLEMDTMTSNIDIEGPGADIIKVSPGVAGNFRLFSVNADTTCKIADLEISGANADTLDGAGINNLGNLTLLGCYIDHNATNASGGGIYNNGELTVSDCEIYYNTAFTGGGGIWNSGLGSVSLCCGTDIFNNQAIGANGGGILNRGDLQASDNTQLVGNSATSGGLGGGLYTQYGTVQFTGGSIFLNRASGANAYGGGVYVASGTASFDTVTFDSNGAAKGGGLYLATGSATLTNCTVQNNTASVLGPGLCWKTGSTLTVVGGSIQSIDPDP
jgi:hypothetical protein